MSAYLCVGGPLHGNWHEAEDWLDEFKIEQTPDIETVPDIPLVYYRHRPERHYYRRRGIGPNCVVWLHHSIPVTL